MGRGLPDGRLKLVQFANRFDVADGGPARHCLELNVALQAGGHDAELIGVCPPRGPSLVPGFVRREQGAWRPATQLSQRLRPGEIGRFLASLRSADAWIVHGYYLPWVPLVVSLAVVIRMPVLLMPHGALTTFSRANSQFKKSVFDRTVGLLVTRWVKPVVATTREAMELPPRLLRRRPIVVGAGTVLPPEFSRLPAHDPIRLLLLSRVAPKKRADLAIAAIAELKERGRAAQLTIGGTGDATLLTRLRRQADEAGVAGLVDFAGQLDGRAKEIAFTRADVFLLPSDDENFGIAVAEALAHGVPVVTTDRVAAADGLGSPACLQLTAPTGQTLADEVERVVRLLPGLRSEARRAASSFSWPRVAQRWVAAARSASGRSPER